MRPHTKLIAQIIAACALVVGGVHIETPWLAWVALPLTILWVVGITNAFNLLDNMDGLSAGTAVIAAGFLFAFSVSVGNVDIAMGGITVLLTLWDKTQGTMNVRGIATMVDSPIFLMTVDPRIKSLKDFGEGDRIAVSAVKVTMQALFLNLAAAREWGWDARFKLDPLTVSMSHPMSIQALRTGKLEVKSYAAIVPYNYEVLTASNARQLMTSYDVLGGAHSLSAIWASETWVKANPKTYQATVAAFEEAVERIATDRAAAARTYSKWEASSLPTADVARIIGTPSEITFTVTPNRTLMIAETMHKIGLLKTKPRAWTDYFHAGLHGKNGS